MAPVEPVNGHRAPVAHAPARIAPKAGRGVVAPKFALGENTWAGRGLKPKWLIAALEEGYTLDQLRVG